MMPKAHGHKAARTKTLSNKPHKNMTPGWLKTTRMLVSTAEMASVSRSKIMGMDTTDRP